LLLATPTNLRIQKRASGFHRVGVPAVILGGSGGGKRGGSEQPRQLGNVLKFQEEVWFVCFFFLKPSKS